MHPSPFDTRSCRIWRATPTIERCPQIGGAQRPEVPSRRARYIALSARDARLRFLKGEIDLLFARIQILVLARTEH